MSDLKDYHVHTLFSDGKDSPEETVRFAIKKGLKEIGFSDHSYTFFDESYCLKKEKTREYISEITRLKDKYKDKIKILLGVEQDYYSEEKTESFDYVIGSVHYIKKGGEYFAVDESKEDLIFAAQKYYGGDFAELYKDYYKTVSGFKDRKEVNIIGHFDLISKFNSQNALFDENAPEYVAAYKDAAEALLSSGKVFEINTGAIKKGIKSDAYPKKEIRDFIKNRGGKFVLSSDSHKKEDLCFGFGDFSEV